MPIDSVVAAIADVPAVRNVQAGSQNINPRVRKTENVHVSCQPSLPF
jgi:hypothetical protein